MKHIEIRKLLERQAARNATTTGPWTPMHWAQINRLVDEIIMLTAASGAVPPSIDSLTLKIVTIAGVQEPSKLQLLHFSGIEAYLSSWLTRLRQRHLPARSPTWRRNLTARICASVRENNDAKRLRSVLMAARANSVIELTDTQLEAAFAILVPEPQQLAG